MDDDIRFEPKRIPFVEIKRFTEYLAALAEEEDGKVAFTERYANVKLSLSYLLEVYEAGTVKKIPVSWVPLYNQMKEEEKEEYQMYLQLEEKYGHRRKISEITTDETLAEEEGGSQAKKKQKGSGGGGKEITKDGNITKFK